MGAFQKAASFQKARTILHINYLQRCKKLDDNEKLDNKSSDLTHYVMAPGMCSSRACRILFMPALQPPLESIAMRHTATEEEIEGNFVLQLQKCEPFLLSQHASKASEWNLEQCDCSPTAGPCPGPPSIVNLCRVTQPQCCNAGFCHRGLKEASDVFSCTRCLL